VASLLVWDCGAGVCQMCSHVPHVCLSELGGLACQRSLPNVPAGAVRPPACPSVCLPEHRTCHGKSRLHLAKAQAFSMYLQNRFHEALCCKQGPVLTREESQQQCSHEAVPQPVSLWQTDCCE
jgi:hypothetical protein